MLSAGILKLSKIIVEKGGNISTKDAEDCGLPFEIFLTLSKMSNERLVSNAKKIIESGEKKCKK